jgi:hypothetical protein
MQRWTLRQVFFYVLSAFIALGMNVHLLAANDMMGKPTHGLAMAADMGGMGPGDCHSCDQGDSKIQTMKCDSVCAASFVALLPEGMGLNDTFAFASKAPAAGPLLAGRLTAPDPSPPKSHQFV